MSDLNKLPEGLTARSPLLEDGGIEFSAEAACGVLTEEQLKDFQLGFISGANFARDLYERHLTSQAEDDTPKIDDAMALRFLDRFWALKDYTPSAKEIAETKASLDAAING